MKRAKSGVTLISQARQIGLGVECIRPQPELLQSAQRLEWRLVGTQKETTQRTEQEEEEKQRSDEWMAKQANACVFADCLSSTVARVKMDVPRPKGKQKLPWAGPEGSAAE